MKNPRRGERGGGVPPGTGSGANGPLLDTVFCACPVASMVLDPDGTVRLWNPAAERMFGWRAAEIIGRADPLVSDACRAEAHDLMEQLRRGMPCPAMQTQRITRSGVPLPVSLSAAPITNAEGAVAGVVVLLADNRDRNWLETQLVQAQRLRAVGQIVGGMAHDFNNRLTTVLGYCELVLEDLPSSSAVRLDVSEIKKAAASAAELTHELLAFCRRQVLQPQAVDLNEVVAAHVPALQATVGPDAQVVVRLALSPGWVAVDRLQVERVLTNLTLNAGEAMPRGGRITIETAEARHGEFAEQLGVEVAPGPYVRLTVSDTGEGMTPDVRARVFEPFFTTKDRGQASGMGLSAVYGIVKQSNGFIDIASQPGRGTTATIWFPRMHEVRETPAAGPDARQGALGVILLVDDDPATRAETRGLLETLGCRVVEAANTHQATGIVANPDQAINLLIASLILPNMSGNELAARLRALRPTLPVLLVPTAGSVATRADAAAAEYTLLERPLTAEALRERIRNLVGGSEENADPPAPATKGAEDAAS